MNRIPTEFQFKQCQFLAVTALGSFPGKNPKKKHNSLCVPSVFQNPVFLTHFRVVFAPDIFFGPPILA